MAAGIPSPTRQLLDTTHHIGSTIAAPCAGEVDRDARFPSEAVQALRQARMLGAFVPVELGGMGCSVSDLSAVCFALGQYC